MSTIPGPRPDPHGAATPGSEMLRTIVKLRGAGYQEQEIADALGVSLAMVDRVLQASKATRPR